MNLPKVYEPEKYESKIYAMWEQGRAFEPRGEGEPYSIVMPPPNANANLHIGTAMTIALQDILIRFHRMNGRKTLYLPGADHAGFETWVVYEKKLEKEGKSRFDFSRDELYSQVWDFVAENRHNFEIQMRALGTSCDWSRFTFTLDDNIVQRAYATFKQLWDDGLVYRGERIVNYCTKHGTSFADIEVEFQEVKSKLWQIRYPLTEGKGEIVVATTRPETMLGDVAVAVHPDDERYKKLIGKVVTLPLVEKTIPIVADEMVDKEFGTGAVKVTPAHDPNDFEVAERHNLPAVTVIGKDGMMTDEAPLKYHDMTALQAREAVLKDLAAGEYIVKEEDYTHSVGHCYKCGTPIQPLIMDQWFVRMKPLADQALKAIEADKIKFMPASRKDMAIAYLENIKDWNISRQIAWGIPIPAFQSATSPDKWVFDTRVDQNEIEIDGEVFRRDPDVFDTWFSSDQWPFATLNYPDSQDFKDYYPLSLMETGGEIFNQWVLRMIMLGLYVTKEVPFKDVYIHGYVMAKDGSKMSKSKGNVIDPQEIISKFGSDPVRMGIIAGRKAGVNQNYDEARFTAARNFCNKLWNIARYIEGALGEDFKEASHPDPKSPADHWIISEITAAKQQVADYLTDYRFSEAYETVYHTIWDKVADWYIEASKSAQNPATLLWVLEGILVMSHPFAPFVTETIWQTLNWHNDEEDMLINTQWWMKEKFDQKAAAQFEEIQNIIKETREVTGAIKDSNVALTTAGSKLVLENAELIRHLAKIGYVQMVNKPGGLKLTSTKESVWLDLSDEEVALYKQQLSDKIENLISMVQKLQKRLETDSYVENAPEELVEETRSELAHQTEQLEHLSKQFKKLQQ